MLRILLLDDDASDADLIAHHLEASGFSFQLARIQTEAQLRHELESKSPDLVLSDHGLPAFDGFTALEIVREFRPELPFIFVSGSNDQGMVAKMYELGATDYVFKRDLEDLSTAVAGALAPPMPTEANPDSPQRELGLRLSSPPSSQRTIALPVGHFSFCPNVCTRTTKPVNRSKSNGTSELIPKSSPSGDCAGTVSRRRRRVSSSLPTAAKFQALNPPRGLDWNWICSADG